ncbi:DUF3006 domain-containing protein [Paenibacillus dakarensis]|uniref:DUF3006 domain-containing protein n=1 Tax=Paenibacillus dakarensis TaxID=1527293 RepID=UPI0006D55A5C|nr:DUF3006 domain-containing protein [Paenibacillus dakarensis]
MKGIVDRFEGDYAVIEVDGRTIDVNKKEISREVKSNDVVVLVDGVWRTDKDQTKRRKKQIEELMKKVWED